jgi:2'-5' RNA ligase
MTTSRLFIALEIPEEIRDRIISIRDSVYGEGGQVKWEPKEKLHITLKFLGDTDITIIEGIRSFLAETIAKHSAMELEFNKFGMFYREAKPSILWLGMNKNVALKELFLELEKGLSAFGFNMEKRDFKPHLTILRIKGKEDTNKLNKLVAEPETGLKFKGEKITLFKSTLLSSGSVYEAVENYFLK